MFELSPIRMQLRRIDGFDLHALSLELNGLRVVNCARPTALGSPFHHDADGHRLDAKTAATHFRAQLMRLGWYVNDRGQTITTDFIVRRAAGKNCACFCKVDSLWCHVDTILQVANGWTDPPAWSGFYNSAEREALESALLGDTNGN